MRYLVKTGELREKTEYIAKQVEIIEENIDRLRKVKDSILWNGVAAKRFINNYNIYLSELEDIKDSYDGIVEYLIGYYNRYGNAYSELRRKNRSSERKK